MEADFVNEQKRHSETIKEMNSNERRVKDLAFQSEEDKKTQNRLQRNIEKLEGKLKSYRRQVEETEEIAAANLGKYRHAQQELESAYERADIAENQVAKLRVQSRSGSVMGRGASAQRESSAVPRADSVRR